MRLGTGGRRASTAALVMGLFVAQGARGEEAPSTSAAAGGNREGGTLVPQGEPLSVVFDASAEDLPQAEIRAAIQDELRRPLATATDAVSERITVRVSSTRGLVLEYRSRGSVLERQVVLPARREDVPLVVALLAGNLVRDQRGALPPPEPPEPPEPPASAAADETEDEPPPAPARTEPRPPLEPGSVRPPPREREPSRHWFGLHVAQDLAVTGGSNVCDPTLGQSSDNYACFLEGTDDRPFVHTPYPLRDRVGTGVVFATTRLLASYDFAFAKNLSAGGRFGYAFGGGPPAGQTLEPDGSGSGGTPFFPLHAEARFTLWHGSPAESVTAFVGVSGGVAQVDAKASVDQKDCDEHAELGAPSAPAEDAFEACRISTASFDWAAMPDVRVDAWKKVGQMFYGVHAGGSFRVSEHLRGVVNLNLSFFAPASGFVMEPSLGLIAGL